MSFTFPLPPRTQLCTRSSRNKHSFMPVWHCRSSACKYHSGVLLAPNGIIYFIPRDADNIGEFDPMTKTFSVVDISSIISSNHKYNGGVLGPNCMIYFVIFHA